MAMNPRLLRPLATLDPDVAAFRAASGATNLTGLNRLAVYLKGQSLWDYSRFYPMKSSQNAGSGSTVYGLGGLTTNNMTLVNSPTWGSDGVTFNGIAQYGNVGDIYDGGDLAWAIRLNFTNSPQTAANSLFGQYTFTGSNERSGLLVVDGVVAGDPFRIIRSDDGTNAGSYFLTGHTVTGERQLVYADFPDGEPARVFQDGVQLSSTGAPLTTFNSTNDWYVGAYNNNGSPVGPLRGTISATLVISGSNTQPNTTQRETITDLINAL